MKCLALFLLRTGSADWSARVPDKKRLARFLSRTGSSDGRSHDRAAIARIGTKLAEWRAMEVVLMGMKVPLGPPGVFEGVPTLRVVGVYARVVAAAS